MKTKEKIINVSIDLFSKYGYAGVSIRDITKIVGIRESSLYKHFKNKQELLNIIFDIFLNSYNKNNISEQELKTKIIDCDLFDFLIYAIEIFFRDMETPTLERIFRILMNEQFRIKKARDLIHSELIVAPINFYSMVFKEKLKNKFPDYYLLACEYHYPLFAMAYEYSLIKFDNKDSFDIKKQMFKHIDFFYHKILSH